MYTIYAGDDLLYAPMLSNEGYGLISPKVDVELNKAGSASFLLPTNNVMYGQLKKMKSIITVYDDKDEIFRGRVLDEERGFKKTKNVYCEGELAFLLDSVLWEYEHSGSVSELFDWYINEHNSQVEQEKQFQVGEVTVKDNNDYIVRSSTEYPKTLNEMKAKLLDLLGGYFRIRKSGENRIIDYVEEYGEKSGQVIEFGKNLLDITEYITADGVFTVLIPLGAEQNDENGNRLGRLTIRSVNEDCVYVEDPDAIKLFGRIVEKNIWDDVTEPDNLLRKAKEHLKSGIKMAVSLTVKAVDLHLINIDTKRIKLGDYVRVVSIPHEIDQYFLCTKISYDLANPGNTEYTLGVSFKTLTDRQAEQNYHSVTYK